MADSGAYPLCGGMREHTQEILCSSRALHGGRASLPADRHCSGTGEDALQEWIVSPRLNRPAVGDDQQLARPHARLLPVSTRHRRQNLSACRLSLPWQSAEAPPHSANIQWLDANELQGAEGDQHVAQTVSSYDFGRGLDASDCRSGLGWSWRRLGRRRSSWRLGAWGHGGGWGGGWGRGGGWGGGGWGRRGWGGYGGYGGYGGGYGGCWRWYGQWVWVC